MVPSDNDSTGSCLFTLLHLIYFIEPLTSVGSFELFGKLVVADTASEHNRFWWENVL